MTKEKGKDNGNVKNEKGKKNLHKEPEAKMCPFVVCGNNEMLTPMKLELNGTTDCFSAGDVSETFFDGHEVMCEKIVLSPERMKQAKLGEPVCFFYEDTGKKWDYNEILSAYFGKEVDSTKIVFITESSLKEKTPFKGSYGDFVTFVENFTTSILNIIRDERNKVSADSNEDDSDEDGDNMEKSGIFRLSGITFNISERGKFRVKTSADEKKELDDFWDNNFRGLFDPNFIFSKCKWHDDAKSEFTMLVCPMFTVIYSELLGRIEIYGNSIAEAQYSAAITAIQGLKEKVFSDDTVNEGEKKSNTDKFYKEREKVLKNFYN